MKHLSKRVLALALSVAMAATMAPVTTAQAASKKTVTVSTQAQLTKALKTKGVSKIIVKTAKAVNFTVKKGKYSAKLEMNAPKATLNNSGTWSAVIVADAKSYTEKAKNNKIFVKDKKLTFTVAKYASVKSVTFAKKGASDTVKINGKVSAITISAPSTVSITDNGSIKKVTVDAKSKVTLSGSSEDQIAVTLTKNAESSIVKSAVLVAVKSSANAAITFKEGAEGSTVAVKTADAKITMTNSTTAEIQVTNADGKKETVASGEKLSTGSSDTGTDKEDEKKDEDKKDEEKKEDEKKPVAGGGGGGTSSGSGDWSGSNDTPSAPTDTTPSLTLDKTAVKLSKWDDPVTLVATKKNIDGEVTWTSSKPEVVHVVDGVVTCIGVDTEPVVITANAGSIQAICTVTTTEDVLSASGFVKAVAATTAIGTVTLGSDISGDVLLTSGIVAENAVLTINMKNYTLDGNMTFNENSSQNNNYTVNLIDNGAQNIGAKITGDLTINAPHAHVENYIWVQGTSNVEAVANATYQVNDRETKVQLKGPGKLDIKADKRIAPQVVVATDEQVTLEGNVTEVSIEKAADITVANGTTVEKIEVQNTATAENKTVSIKGAGTVTSMETKAPVEVAVNTTEMTAAAPVVLSGTAEVSNIYVEDNAATINVDSSVKVESLSVNNTAVSEVKISGSGEVKTVDITKATESVSVSVDEGVANNIKDVVATTEQSANIASVENSNIKEKVKTPKAIQIVKTPTKTSYFVGEIPVVTGASIKIVYQSSDETEVLSDEITVTEKMLDLSAVNKDTAGSYSVKVAYAGLPPVELVSLTYVSDTVAKVKYEADSMKKLTYTRKDAFDPAGAVITLTYASGKTEQIADTSKMTFTDESGNPITTVSPEQKGDYIIKVTYNGTDAGSQTVKANPIYYTVSLNANESVNEPDRVQTVRVEEFTTLKALSEAENSPLKLTETIKPLAHENRMWTFVKWTLDDVEDDTAYSWTTPVTSDLKLIGFWTKKDPEEDTITINVGDGVIKQGDFPVYTVKAGSVSDFLNTVTASSAKGGDILIKYGIAGTSGDQMVAYDPATSVFEVGKKYEILYYTEDGASFDGNWASILFVTQATNVVFTDSANGIITNCDGMIDGSYGVVTNYLNYEKMKVNFTVTSAPDGADINNLQVECVARSEESISVQIHSVDKSTLPAGTYTLDLTYQLLGADDSVLTSETCKVSYTFDHIFSSKENSSWKMNLNGDGSTEMLSMPYDSQKSTLADYLDASVKSGSILAYADATDVSGAFTTISSLAGLVVESGKSYSIRVTNTDGENAYFMFSTYTGVQVVEAKDVNLNCIKMRLTEPLTQDVSLTVTDDTDSANPSAMEVSQKMGSGATYYIWLKDNMVAGRHYTVAMTGGNVIGIMAAGVTRKPDEAYNSRNTVTDAVITDDTHITVTLSATPTGELKFVVMKQPDGTSGWEPIEATFPSTIDSNTIILTTTESLTDQTIRLCVCGDDLKEAYDKEKLSESTDTSTS